MYDIALIFAVPYLTCFADPVHVAVHFPLQFLLFFEQKEARTTLHTVFFFGELSRGKGEQQQR